MHRVDVIVLCGGTSRRFGGSDKTAAQLGGRSLLDGILSTLPDWPIVCVGDPRPTCRGVRWVREEPPGSGPLAGIAAGLASTTGDLVVVLAGDQPFAGPAARALVEALDAAPDAEAAAARQPDGRPQLLLAAYRRDALVAATAGDVRDVGVHRRLARLRVHLLDVSPRATFDVDTPQDLSRARDDPDTFLS